MSKRVIVATMWCGPRSEGAVDETAPPTPADLYAIAVRLTPENCGVKPVMRVLENATPPPFVDTGEPVCEEVYEWPWRRYVRRW
jgi:hypothetical protein